MSEETHDAAIRGPIAIQTAVLVSGILGWILTITMCFCINDLDSILHTPTGLPAAQIFLNAGGKGGGTIMWSFVILVQFCTGCSAMLADTRMAYAFARDEALPFSKLVISQGPLVDKLLTYFSKNSRQSECIHTYPCKCRLVRGVFWHLSQLHRDWIHTDSNGNFQRDGAST